MSIRNNFPSIRPSLNLDFANVKALDPRITFTRTTTATYYGTETAKAEENLLLQSQDFTTTWTNSGSSDTANTEVAPDGTTTADTITASASTAAHFMNQGVALVVGQTYVLSVFLKAGTNDYAQLTLGTQSAFANFDLDLGVTGTSGGSVDSSSIVSVGNGWYRCIMTWTQVNANSVVVSVASSDSDTRLQAWTAVGTETIYAWGAQLEQRSAVTAYTPTTTQPITNYIPVLLTAASGVARFDHNPLTGESLGLLVEEQRTNLILRSEDFSTTWTTARANLTTNTIVAPPGELTGDKAFVDTQNGWHYVAQTISVASGTTYTLSLYAKKAEQEYVQMHLPSSQFGDTNAGNGAVFNLTTGAISDQGANLTAASITSVGNGWYRCSITKAASSTASALIPITLVNQATFSTSGYTGDGYSGIYIWGAQLEAGAFPTSYIPTVAATVTRNADAASMTGTNFSSWYRADEGTLYAEAASQKTTSACVVSLDDGSSANTINISPSNATGSVFFGVQTNNVGQLTGASRSASVVPFKTIIAYKTNDTSWTLNGEAVTTDTSVILPVVDRMAIGFRGTSTIPLVGTIKKLSFYPTRLSNAQLQALTTV